MGLEDNLFLEKGVYATNAQLVEHGLFLRLTIVQVHGWLNAFLTTRPALDPVWESNFGRPRHRRELTYFHAG